MICISESSPELAWCCGRVRLPTVLCVQ